MTTSPIGRTSYSKNESTVPLPNLIQVQRSSYEDFLKMDLLPEERANTGLQSVLSTIFPFTDFRETCELQFVRYDIGNWSCRCGRLSGLEHLRLVCEHCGVRYKAGEAHAEQVVCPDCGKANRNRIKMCGVCGTSVALRLTFSEEECRERGMSYAVPIRLTFRMVTFDTEEDGSRQLRDVKEEDLYFGDLPLMTRTGTFIINGTERVIVSQLHRSPGVFFTLEGPNHYLAKVVPYRGSWIEFEYDNKQILWVRIDRKRRLPATVFLRALSPELETNSMILKSFHVGFGVRLDPKKTTAAVALDARLLKIEEERQAAQRYRQVKDPHLFAGLVLDDALRGRIEKAAAKGKATSVKVDRAELVGAIVLEDVVDPETGEVIALANSRVTDELLAIVEEAGLRDLVLAFPDWDSIGEILHQTLEKDSSTGQMEARMEIYRRQRPGDPPTEESATTLFNGLFFDERKYNLSAVGRFKFNAKLGMDKDVNQRILDVDDFKQLVTYLLRLHRDLGRVDDIDSLANRRVRTVGELMENQFRIGLVRMERAIKEKMSIHPDIDSAMPRDLVNSKPVTASVDEFFGSSQLSQFMDQTNPLSEVTHKRRLSALGPGGLSRERAGFEVRDVHSTHYGRICPIETPEGPNIGLISSLSCYARLNTMGFIESPYKMVEGGRVLEHVRITQVGDSKFKIGQIVLIDDFDKVNDSIRRSKSKEMEAWGEPYAFYLPAWEEENLNITQANAAVDETGLLIDEKVISRSGGEFLLIDRNEVNYIDVSPRQVVSVAASLIPFLEHDDANRALMGSNMQRQAVPLVRPESPIVGTGMESRVAHDSGAVVICHRQGVVDKVDGHRIIVRIEGEGEGDFGADIYQLTKFRRSNQNTSINQKPLVKEGQTVVKGQVLADGPNTENGELALGHNILVAFMPWRGYNFEDAIVVSEQMVKHDKYTSIHIEEFEASSRDTKLGPEEITRDIPNISESALSHLDDAGVIQIGSPVKQGSILVGKVTPKGETQLTPEEKLLRAIFGEKAGDVRDASLRCPPGIEGVVVDVHIFARKGVEKDSRQLEIETEETDRIRKNSEDEKRIILEVRDSKIQTLLEGAKVTADVKGSDKKVLIKKGAALTQELVVQFKRAQILSLPLKDPVLHDKVRLIVRQAESQVEVLEQLNEERIELLRQGDELAPGVIKQVRVFIAMKRKLQVGDKMAGRHGNKGVISQCLPEEDLPFLPDGTPVEIILNPLGVPSRMNVGQILETHLGWAGNELEMKFATPVFEGATEDEIHDMLDRAGLPEDGKSLLYDGMTGEPFENRVTVGYIYMLKLSHLVDDKIHARSIGPYSLITQQPLGGKAQFGGQRLGEMEVWALEAYGAAHTLQELLTVKSDDVDGRAKVYESIVKGQVPEEPGLPESFNVLVRELQALGLDVELLQQDNE
ncbi:MAG: DNA-directed RNA polymerase subunit beta [Thermoanaerobaculales bacterium]|nr:DNA-directed RNA polymerase subunit beta [Thermoanaerobaculales bacterium]